MLEEVNKLKDENFLILHGTADGEMVFILWKMLELFFFFALSFLTLFISLCVLIHSKGTLPAQRWTPESSGEGGGQLLTAAVSRWGAHPERAPQHQTLPADNGELPPNLLEAQAPPRYHRGWRGGRWLSPNFLFLSFWRDFLQTVCHLLHYLGSNYQAQAHRSGDQTHQITSYNVWKH